MPCLTCGVPNGGGGYCAEHQPQRRRPRSRTHAVRTAQRGYDSAWRSVRRLVLERDGRVCWWCGDVATTVDHVVPISVAPDLRLDPANLVAACLRCNSGHAGQR